MNKNKSQVQKKGLVSPQKVIEDLKKILGNYSKDKYIDILGNNKYNPYLAKIELQPYFLKIPVCEIYEIISKLTEFVKEQLKREIEIAEHIEEIDRNYILLIVSLLSNNKSQMEDFENKTISIEEYDKLRQLSLKVKKLQLQLDAEIQNILYLDEELVQQKSKSGELEKQFSPMTTKEVKKLVKEKNWLLKEVAERWEISPRQMSNIVQNQSRNIYYDDAFRGLPNKIKEL